MYVFLFFLLSSPKALGDIYPSPEPAVNEAPVPVALASFLDKSLV